MKKQVLTAAIGVALIVPLAASAAVTVYGKLNLGVARVDNGNDVDNTTTGVTDDASRLGIKGDEDLGEGFKAIYQFELSIDADEGGLAVGATEAGDKGPARTTGRDVYAGLQGGWGTIRLGQFNSAYKNVSTGLELFGDTIGDFTSYKTGASTALANETRITNAVSYSSPDFGGFKFSIETARGETSGANGFGTASVADDVLDESNPTIVALSYKGGPVYVGVGQYDADNQLASAVGIDKARKAALSVALGDFTLLGVYEKQTTINELNEVKTSHIGASYKFGKSTIATTYTKYDSNVDDLDSDQVALGFFQELSKSTIVKFVWTSIKNDDLSVNSGRVVGANAGLNNLGATTAGNDPGGFQTQLSLSF